MGDGPGQLADFESSPLGRLRTVHPHVQEGKRRWQEAHMYEKVPDKTQTQNVEARSGHPGSNTEMPSMLSVGLGKQKPTRS